MIKVTVSASNKYPVDRKRIKALVQDFLKEQGVTTELEVGVAIVGDRKMRELNKKYLKRDTTTDVLSFSQMESLQTKKNVIEPEMNLTYLGDVIVSWPQAVQQAAERNHTADEEIDFLVSHGLLHLMGIHHD